MEQYGTCADFIRFTLARPESPKLFITKNDISDVISNEERNPVASGSLIPFGMTLFLYGRIDFLKNSSILYQSVGWYAGGVSEERSRFSLNVVLLLLRGFLRMVKNHTTSRMSSYRKRGVRTSDTLKGYHRIMGLFEKIATPPITPATTRRRSGVTAKRRA